MLEQQTQTRNWKEADNFPPLGRRLKILVFLPNEGGCAYYRAILPYRKLEALYPNVVEVRFDKNPLGIDTDNQTWIKDFQFENMHWADVIVTNNLSNYGGPYTTRACGKAREFGKIFHFDTDDLLTELYEGHRLSGVYKERQLSEITKFIYNNSHIISVTQAKFAERVKPHLSTAVLAVIKNAIDYDLPGWSSPKVPPPKKNYCRFGWAGGIHHEEDVKEFQSIPYFVNQRVGSQNCRWDFYGKPPIPEDPAEREREAWQQDVWKNYQRILMRGFKGAKNWNIFPAFGAEHYGIFYANMDVAIAPLQNNVFNDSKSEIKVAEAGRYKVPLVASNVGCYDEWILNWKNGYLVDPEASRTEWVKVLTKLAKDRSLREKMGENLHHITEQVFNINKVVDYRLTLYENFYEWHKSLSG